MGFTFNLINFGISTFIWNKQETEYVKQTKALLLLLSMMSKIVPLTWLKMYPNFVSNMQKIFIKVDFSIITHRYLYYNVWNISSIL